MTQAWGWAAGLLFVAALSTWGGARQANRRDLDRPGWMPWQLVTVLAGMGALAAAVIALRS